MALRVAKVDSPTPAAATSAVARALLRLHTLRACVRGIADNRSEVDYLGPDGGSGGVGGGAILGGSSESGEGAVAAGTLPALLDARIRALLPELRVAMAGRLVKALSELGWPGELSKPRLAGQVSHDWSGANPAAPQALRELRAAMGELLLLEYICDASSGGAQVAAGDGNAVGEDALWAMDTLLAPLLKRFRYHFETRRETNRRDKPEWMYSHVAGVLRLHAAFLEEGVQRMLLSPLPLLREASSSDAALASTETRRFTGMLRARCTHGALAAVAGGLCRAIVSVASRAARAHRAAAHVLSHAQRDDCLRA